MKYLHVAIVEDYEECFVSTSSDGLREQVSTWLAGKSLLVPNDEEWAIRILAIEDRMPTDPASVTPLLLPISYYKVESRLED